MRTLNTIAGALVYLAALSLVPLSGIAFFHSPAQDQKPLFLPVWAALFLALITPFAIIAIRSQVRYSRVRLIDLFARNFELRPYDGKTKDLISFEFVRGKYFVDLPATQGEPTIDQVPRFPTLLHADWMLLFCALPYLVFAGAGAFLLFATPDLLLAGGTTLQWLEPSMLVIGGLPSSLSADPIKLAACHLDVLAVAGTAFAGAYFFTLRLFLRAVVTFDLSPVTLLRAFAHMTLAVFLAIVLYRVSPSVEALKCAASVPVGWVTHQGVPTCDASFDPREGVTPIWLLVAFALGFIPDAALYYVLQKSGLTFKDRYWELEKHTKLVPLTLLDGIDHMMAFRLEEANIFDVQNLAAYNPIMLHIESPFGIYQTIDWVAQAQLCLVVGPDRFLAMKTLNLRTIFDLEKAVNSANPDVIDAIAELLFQDETRDAALRADTGMLRLPVLQLAPGSQTALSAEARRAAVTAMVAVMLDDLHVVRLRELWNRIRQRLERDGAKAA